MDTHSGALYGDMNRDINDNFSLLLSPGIDNDEYSNYLFLPCAIILYRMDQKNVFRHSLRQSLRKNTTVEQLRQNPAENASSQGTLNGAELLHYSILLTNLQMNSSAFYYEMEYLIRHAPVHGIIF